MLEVEKKTNPIEKMTEERKKNRRKKDIIVTKYEKKIEYDKDGNEVIKRIPINVNITKKVNESKKLIKNYTAEQKIEELERIFSK